MAKVLLTVRIDEDTKKQLRAFSSDLGFTVSGTVSALIKQAVRDKRIFLTTKARGTYWTEPMMHDD